MEAVKTVKGMIAMVLAVLTALWGWFGWVVLAWGVLMALDWVTGSWAAKEKGIWSSEEAKRGFRHKVTCLICVAVAIIFDMLVGAVLGHIPGLDLPVTYSVFFGPLMLFWYIITEAGSILENVVKLGGPVPSWFLKAVATLKGSVDKQGEELTKETNEKGK